MVCDLEYKAGAPHATTNWDDRDVVARAAQQEQLLETLQQHQGNTKLFGSLLSGAPQIVPTVSRAGSGTSNSLPKEDSGQDGSQGTGFAGGRAMRDLLFVNAGQPGNGPCGRPKAAALFAGAPSGKASLNTVDAETWTTTAMARAAKVFEDFHSGQLLSAGRRFSMTVQWLRWDLEHRQHKLPLLMRTRVQEALERLSVVVTVTRAFNVWYNSAGLSSCCC